MKYQVSGLHGVMLIWAVLKASPPDVLLSTQKMGGNRIDTNELALSIIDKEKMELTFDDGAWHANTYRRWGHGHKQFQCRGTGETPVIAVMRCFVESKFGAEIEIGEWECRYPDDQPTSSSSPLPASLPSV